MAVWFVQGEDADVGPLKPAELLSLVREGTVEAETMIRKDDSKWFAAKTVGGLFEAARRPTIEHFCPHCETRVEAPPTTCPKCDQALLKTRTRITEHSIGKSKQNASDGSGTKKQAPSTRQWFAKRIKKDPQ